MRPESNAQTDQHYVPQLLLRGFASGKRKQIYVFDKSTEKVFRSSVRNLACERGFYRLQDGDDPNRVDRWLGKLEEATAPIIQALRARKTLNHLQIGERQWLAAFIAVQHVRTRHHRELSADINKQMADAIREMGTEPNSVKNFRELTDAEAREFAISDVPRLAFTLLPHILDKSWVLLAAAPGTEVWIGDHPVVLANNINPGGGITGTLGFAVRGIEIYLPISSELTLGCLCPTIPTMVATANWRLQQFALPTLARNDEFLKAFTGSATLQLDAENVKYHNSLQAIRAERFVFSQHQNFDLLQEMLASDPTLRTGPRIEIVGRSRSQKIKVTPKVARRRAPG
jgi:Protein of unknown function (DUF4238)